MDEMKKVGLALAAGASFGAAGVFFYLLLKKESMVEYDTRIIKSKKTCHVSRIKIPAELVGSFIGREGSNIKAFQQRTNTRINFLDSESDDEQRTAIIRGSLEDVEEARDHISHFITNRAKILTEEIYVPQNACGLLIGRNGDNIRHMCQVSKAKITIDSCGPGNSDSGNLKLVTIHGEAEQIELAKMMIEEKLHMAEEKFSSSYSENETENRSQKLDDSDIKHQLSLTAPPNNEDQYTTDGIRERLIATSNDGFCETYVSAVENPSKFWVQIVGVRSVALDKLVDSMTKFYAAEDNKFENSIGEVIVGDLIAVPFSFDDSWYRAEIIEVLKDDYDPSNTQVVAFYVDFGETCTLKVHEICKLKQNYMVLPFQAIECCLAGVCPKGGSQWEETAIKEFELLVNVAQWKIVMVKNAGHEIDDCGRGVYIVDVVDTNTDEDLNVADKLIKENFAVRRN